MALIEVKNFSKYYEEDKPVLKDISLRAERGKTLVIIGKSGCGKSTLLRHIAGLEGVQSGPIEGEIVLEGRWKITHMPEREIVEQGLRGRVVGMLFQNSALFDFLDVEGNLRWAMEENLHLSPSEIQDKIAEVLETVDIDLRFLKRDVSTLSGGEKKRVALARALVLEPKILLYDEPTTGLDPPTAAEIIRLINRLRQRRRITSVVTTHDMWCAGKIADSMAMIYQGSICFQGTYQEALENAQVRSFMEGK